MKFISVLFATMILAACSTGTAVKTNPRVDMKNPAAVYCNQQGGTLSMVKTKEGTSGYCTLPSGEQVGEWVLYHRDHPQK